MHQKQHLVERVAAYEPASDVDDLDTARRMITWLRNRVMEEARRTEPIEGEYTAFLDDKHERMLRVLYTIKRLGFADDPNDSYWLDPPELEEAFSDFVEGALDVAWDMAQIDHDLTRDDAITPSA